MISGGIYGTIRGLDDEAVNVEVGSGAVLRVAPGTIAQHVEPEVEPSDDATDDRSDGGSQSPPSES